MSVGPSGGARATAGAGSFWARVRRVLRIRRTIVAGPVRYTETSTEPLHRALSRHGGGSKEFIAEFRDGGRMRIRCTRDRVYDDLSPDPRRELGEGLGEAARPGMRVLIMGGGSGVVADRLGRRVGPSGGVVSIERDEESARFAQRRYARANAAFEAGDVKSLAGELDGAFDIVVAFDALPGDDEGARAVVAELGRVTAPGGRLVVATRPAGPEGPTPESAGAGAGAARGAIGALAASGAAGAFVRVDSPTRVGCWEVDVLERAPAPG